MSNWNYRRTAIDHYIVVWLHDKKKLAQVLSKDKDSLQIVLEENRHDPETRTELTVDPADIILNLGPDPLVGSVHGCKVEPWVKTIDSSFWGQIHLYKKLCKEDLNELKKALSTCKKALKFHNLRAFLPLDIEVRHSGGRFSGSYKFRPKGTDTIILNPKDFHPSAMPYLCAHELAHGVWYRMVPSHIKARWVKLYHSYTQLIAATPQDIRSVREELEQSNLEIREFRKLSGDVDILKECLTYIKRKHGLTTQHIDILLSTNASLAKFWPITIQMFNIDAPITDYSKDSPEEFFAEALAHYLMKIKLPSRIDKAITQTLLKVNRHVS